MLPKTNKCEIGWSKFPGLYIKFAIVNSIRVAKSFILFNIFPPQYLCHSYTRDVIMSHCFLLSSTSVYLFWSKYLNIGMASWQVLQCWRVSQCWHFTESIGSSIAAGLAALAGLAVLALHWKHWQPYCCWSSSTGRSRSAGRFDSTGSSDSTGRSSSFVGPGSIYSTVR